VTLVLRITHQLDQFVSVFVARFMATPRLRPNYDKETA
jgi:hypothetical protein